MKLDFCCVCGDKEDLHQHHIVPVVLSGVKRTSDTSDNTITVCAYHHDIIHGVIKNRSADHSTMIKKGMENAKQKGIKVGRPSKLNSNLMTKVYHMWLEEYSIRDISKTCGIGIGTTYKAIELLEKRQNGDDVNISEAYENNVQKPDEPATFLDLY
jgi:hypothetical protein